MATMIPPQKNVEYIFYVGLVSQVNTKLLQNNPTLAAGDVLVSTDGGATSNLDTLPAVTPASSDIVKVTVSTTEMNGDNIIIVFSDVAGSEWCDLIVNIQTSAQSLDTIDTNVDSVLTDTGTTLDGKLDTIDSNVDAILVDTGTTLDGKITTVDTVVDGIQTDLSNGTDGLGALKALIDTLDTVADAVKAVTDALPNSGALSDLATILTDTGELQTDWVNGGRLDLLIDAILTDTGTTLPATLATIAAYIDAEVAAILTDTGTTLPATLATIAGYLDTEIAAIKAKTDLRPSGIPKNVALSNVPFVMALSSDHITSATGKTVTTQISKDGGAFANTTNSASEIGNGVYKIDLTQTEMNADKVTLKCTETNCDQRTVTIFTST